ncbi:ComEC/Rec2 family competence protein [Nocardia camponoti]|uniref:Competence protein ComEC n=1 Tax=Nocardia camponoti TaxID=1616106 RepID=A0A917VDF4_9NOCA|nr:ComEC/Rec2 family competence protein [Nocardia camponoti]GGK63762.1 competence protein ComEC [Nocardia camponoti]
MSEARTNNDAGASPAVEQSQPSVLDLRLVPAALGCWLATIAAVTLGPKVGVAIAVGAVLGAIALWVMLLWSMAHRRERWRVVAAAGIATMVVATGFSLAGAWRAHEVAHHPLRSAFGRTATVVAVISDDPKPMHTKGFGGQRRLIVRAELRSFSIGPGSGTEASGTIIVLAGDGPWARVSPGQTVRVRAEVAAPARADLTVAALHANGPPDLLGAPPWWQRAAGALRADLVAAASRSLPPDAAGLLPALVVGDTSALSDRVRDDFAIAGLQHLTVVSGANLSILLTALLALARLVALGPRWRASVAAIAVVLFIVVARPDPSVLRAAAMGSVTVLALLTGRRRQAIPALCGAVLGLLVVAPQLAVSAGFALSVLATAGLILLAPRWADWLRERGWWRGPAEVVAVASAAFVVTLPLTVALSGQVSLVAVLANALVAPTIGVITVVGAAGALVAWCWGDAAVWLLWCARLPMWWLLTVAEWSAGLPGAVVTVPGGAVGGFMATGVVVVLIAVLRWSRVRRLLAATALGICLVLIPVRCWHPGWPVDGWVLAMCDVGQGDGFALSVASGSAVVVDAGPDPRAIRRCLDRLDVERVPLLVLTHPHADHIDGLAGVLAGRTVDAIGTAPGELTTAATSFISTADQARASADGHVSAGSSGAHAVKEAATRARIPLLELHSGLEFTFGTTTVAVLAPGPRPPSSFPGDTANDRSIVLRAHTPAGTILLTGDIETPVQRELIATASIGAIDILKVPHHGSRTTTPEFLRATRPRLALISSGKDNTFGHPHPDVLSTLRSMGATIARTDNSGDILIFGNPRALRTITARRTAERVSRPP